MVDIQGDTEDAVGDGGHKLEDSFPSEDKSEEENIQNNNQPVLVSVHVGGSNSNVSPSELIAAASLQAAAAEASIGTVPYIGMVNEGNVGMANNGNKLVSPAVAPVAMVDNDEIVAVVAPAEMVDNIEIFPVESSLKNFKTRIKKNWKC